MTAVRAAAARVMLTGCAAIALLVVKGCLRIAPARTIRLASRRGATASPDARQRVARLTTTVQSLAPVPLLSSNCLSRSLTVLLLARAAGISPTLVIGACRSGRELHAHAWLELRGVVLPRQETRGYERLWAAS